MSHEELNYDEILRSRGFRVTMQRLMILDAICEAGDHSTIGQIVAHLKHMDTSIDRSTVYRALDLFVELGLVVSGDVGLGEPVYEIAQKTAHHHLVCETCGRTVTLTQQDLQPVFTELGQKYDFSITMDHLIITGLCAACRRKSRRGRPNRPELDKGKDPQ